MGELTIRRNKGFTVPRYQAAEKTEKTAGSSASQRVSGPEGAVRSEALRQLAPKDVPTDNARTWESRQTLQTGEGALAEIQDKLSRMAELAKEAASGGEAGREALQAELDQLGKDLDRIIRGAVAGDVPLFLDEAVDLEAGAEVLMYALLKDGTGALPGWLTAGIAQNALSTEQLLAALGLNKGASLSDLLRAIADVPLDRSPAASYLAALYLGAVISGGPPSGPIDPAEAMAGLQKLLEKVAEGVSPDEAVAELTNGAFTSLASLEAQFSGGTAPGLSDFLSALLLADASALLTGSSALAFLAGLDGMSLDLMMCLLNAGSTGPSEALGASPEAQAQAGPGPGAGPGPEAAAEAAPEGAPRSGAPAEGANPAPLSTARSGGFQVTGRDLSGVSFHAETGQLAIGGTADVTVQGTGQGSLLITGSGVVTLEGAEVRLLTVDTPEARLFSAGENVLQQIQLREGAVLTLSGSGLVRTGAIEGDGSNVLRLTSGGAVVLSGQAGILGLPVLVDGPVSMAARAANVRNFSGEPMEPFDLIWKSLLPGWNKITAMEVDGRQARMAFLGGNTPEPVRLWLEKWNPAQGWQVHSLVLWGEDEFGNPRARYAYLHWNQAAGGFQEAPMYPNPFTVTGGEQDKDWVYEEDTHTLRILSNQVTGISGGAGTDGTQAPFSGRVALASRLGAMALTLNGVTCRVSSGRAFALGEKNDVTLMLRRGTENRFESGAGCAGISLGDGTSLKIDCTSTREERGAPVGALTATGGDGGAGIGRDSGESQDRTSRILILAGAVTATGMGGGAGIGAGRRGFMGPVTITGGVIHSTGGTGGGAGIGGALGAPVGDISIQGGSITAVAARHAAAIGAGVQGESGDILITGTARIVKAVGGSPGADIGACRFGSCGKVQVSGGASIGTAKLWTRPGIPLQTGADTMTLPQFSLSSRVLGLDQLNVSTRDQARKAQAAIDLDRRWVSQIQAAYGALYSRMENFSTIRSEYERRMRPVRDNRTARSLLGDILLRPSQAVQTHSRGNSGDLRQLLR
ncbi:MAG: hypothetical protein HFF18_10755 [Oscillospiraceae bacterium]|nr:hypothetical protein [Oscillospiraceae bacterium]